MRERDENEKREIFPGNVQRTYAKLTCSGKTGFFNLTISKQTIHYTKHYTVRCLFPESGYIILLRFRVMLMRIIIEAKRLVLYKLSISIGRAIAICVYCNMQEQRYA